MFGFADDERSRRGLPSPAATASESPGGGVKPEESATALSSEESSLND